MTEIKNCLKCSSKAHLRKERRPIQNSAGNGYHKTAHDFYVCCPKCYNMGKWFKSNSDKAIRDWNRKQV